VEAQVRSDRAYLDLGCGITQLMTEDRVYKRQNDWRDRTMFEPHESYKRFVLPPSEHLDQPALGLASRYCHTSINKIRHPVYGVTWSPDGRRLITASANSEFTLWSSFGFIADSTIADTGAVYRAMTWSKSGEYMLTAGVYNGGARDKEGVIKYWNPQMRQQKEISGHDGPVRGVSFCPTDLKFCSGSDDVTVRVWDFETGQEEVCLRGHSFDVKTVEWHPHKSLILSGSRDNLCKLWNPRSGKELCSLTGHKNTLTAVRWNPHNGNWFATTSRDKTIRVYDIRMIKQGDPCLYELKGHRTEIYSAAWHPIHEEVLATGGYDGMLMFWMVTGPDKEGVVQATVPAAHEGAIWTMDWAPAGHLLCTGSQDKTCKFWSRMRPGMSELLLYKGYQRNVDELDLFREMQQAPPRYVEYESYQEQKESEVDCENDVREMELDQNPEQLQIDHVLNLGKKHFDKTLSQYQLQRDLATHEIPGLEGPVDLDNAKSQAGMLLVPPEVFQTYVDGDNYTSELDMSRFVTATNSGILQRQQGPAGASGVRETMEGAPNIGTVRTNTGSAPAMPASNIDPTNLPGERITGFVKMFDPKGFGFIRPHDPSYPDLFVQKSDIEPGFGKNGEQNLERQDIVVFRVEVGQNRHTGKPQQKARQIVHGDYDPERVRRQRLKHQQEQRSGNSSQGRQQRDDNRGGRRQENDRGRHDGDRGGRYDGDRAGGRGYNDSRGRDRGQPDNRQHGQYNHPPPSQDGRYGGGAPPPPRVNPQELLTLLAQHQHNPETMNRILEQHGVSLDQVQRMIEEQRRGQY